MNMKINLDSIVFKDGENIWNVIVSHSGYLLYQESSDEYAIDFTILDKNLNEIDGGLLCWGGYNEATEMYDIQGDKEGFTYKEFLDEVNTYDSNVQFDEHSVRITDEEVIDFIWEHIN